MPSQNSRRKSKFKDIAGDLVSHDRASKKNSWVKFNLGQAIASELEKAYQLGLKAQKGNADDKELPLEFCDVPRRFRAAYERLGMVVKEFSNAGYIEHRDNRGHFYYDVLDIKSAEQNDSFAMSSIHGLYKLGVLEIKNMESYEAYVMSELGQKVLTDAIKAGEATDWSF